MSDRNRLKKKGRWKRAISCICLFIMMFYEALTSTEAYAQAGTIKEETMEYLPLGNNGGDVRIGRYQFNYVGNWNYISHVDEVNRVEWGKDSQNVLYDPNAPSNFFNCSKGTLTNSSGAKGIVKAYLIWETRKAYDAGDYNSNHVKFVMRDGRTAADIYPDNAYCDNRTFVNWRNPARSSYCMVADVTRIVQAYGYGDYYVANIPVYNPVTDYNDEGGGMNPAAWQLVVVEESDNFPVRAVTMKIGATFRFGDWDFDGYNGGYVYPNGNTYNQDNYKTLNTAVTFNTGIRTKSSGNVTGQVLVGCIDDPGNPSRLGSVLYTQQSVGGGKTVASAGAYPNMGLCRNNVVFQEDKCVSVNLSDISGGLGNNATVVGAELNNLFWNTQFYVGTAIDIAFPDFIANQTTTTNSSTSVTVTGNIQNVSQQANTGIYDGELVVNIDPALTVTSATAIVDGNKSITGIVSGNTVKFSGEAIKNIMKGNTITYTVECQPNRSGVGRYENSDSFSGKLRADGVDTRYWINNACTSSSYALAKYKVALNAGIGIKDVSGDGEYTYGQKVSIDAELLPGYHWKDWTGSYNTTIQKYTFDMPAQNITLTANGEANEYTIHFDPNDGTEVTPIPDMTVRYDEEISLPDATNAYIKYTLDGVNVTQNILDGTIVLDENGVVMMMLDEETGAMMTPDGATVSADGIMTKTNEDGSTTVTYPDGNVVTVSPEGIRTDISADGSKKVIYPDGNVVRVNPYGTTVPSDDAATGTTGETGADESTDGEASGTTGATGTAGDRTESTGVTESTEATEGTEPTESTEAIKSTEGTETVKNTEKTASVERNAVSRVTTAADGADNGTDTGTNATDLTAAQADLADDPDAEPKPDKKAYASVFMGWSLEEEKDTFVPQWKAGEPLKVSDLVDLAGMTDTNGATITLYAVWDDCPWIVAENLYYTLAQAQSGFITQDEILSHATAYDREDGSPIAPGVHEDGTSFTIPDYSLTDFTQFQHEGSCTENLTVVDSVGNTYWKQITVYIVDTTPVAVKPEGTTRFIDEYYYNQPYENGGLEDNSIWKTDPEYAAVLQSAFDNLKNDTPVETYYFTHEDILAMKQYIDDNGFGNTQSEDALNRFYDQFMALNQME
ncbi:MAG: hypothetical protein J6K53_10420 [Roseburia sp.]|nr:hypothetical protein [Roseburia sp.]